MNVRGGHFLKEDIGAFDAPFFSITSKEAASMDPQQRILLETAYTALENGKVVAKGRQSNTANIPAAGIPMEQVIGSKTSVHTGCFTRDYSMLAQKDPEILSRFAITSGEGSMLSNRISWFYDLTGPSATVDTACSSSLMALHLACQTLRNGEATMVVQGTSYNHAKKLIVYTLGTCWRLQYGTQSGINSCYVESQFSFPRGSMF